MTAPTREAPRLSPPGRFPLALAGSAVLHGAALAGLLWWGLAAPRPPELPPVEVVEVPRAESRPVPAVDQTIAAALRSALDLPREPAAESPPEPVVQPPPPPSAWPRVPVKIRPPRVQAQVAETLRAPDAPPPIPATDPIDLQKGLRTAAAPAVPSLEPARAAAGNPPPAYPDDARRKGLQGQVTLRVRVTADGRPESVLLVESSGWSVLDDAAIAAVEAWRFEPARRGGRAEAATIDLPVVFRLGG